MRNPAPPRPNVLGPGPIGPGPDFCCRNIGGPFVQALTPSVVRSARPGPTASEVAHATTFLVDRPLVARGARARRREPARRRRGSVGGHVRYEPDPVHGRAPGRRAGHGMDARTGLRLSLGAGWRVSTARGRGVRGARRT